MPCINPPLDRRDGSVRSECTMPEPAVIQLTSPGQDLLADTQTVTVMDFAIEQIGDRRQADMRMRPDIDPLAGAEIGRSHVVEKDERTHHATSRERQHPANLQAAAEVLAPCLR